jgi:uncharacterized membrane protein YecN with MAPEG domain
MTSFQVVALYVALNIILAVILMLRVGTVRLGKKVNLGDGGDSMLLARIRSHGNFVENAPFALLGLIGLAMMNGHILALHVFGVAFLLGRVLHAQGMEAKGAIGKGRGLGMMLTLFTHLGQAAYLLFLVFTFNVT